MLETVAPCRAERPRQRCPRCFLAYGLILGVLSAATLAFVLLPWRPATQHVQHAAEEGHGATKDSSGGAARLLQGLRNVILGSRRYELASSGPGDEQELAHVRPA